MLCPLKINVWEALFVFVKLHLPFGGVHDVMPHPAVIGDKIQLLKLILIPFRYLPALCCDH